MWFLNDWIFLSIVRTIATVFIILLQKSIVAHGNIIPSVIGISVGIIMFLNLLLIEPRKNMDYLLRDNQNIIKIIIIIVLTIIAILSGYHSLQLSSNPAYIRTFVAIEIIILLLVGYFFFGHQVTFWKLIGCFLVAIGMILVILNDNAT